MRDGVTRSDECRLFAFVQDDEPKYGGRYGHDDGYDHDDRYDHDGRGARLPLLYALVPSEQQRQGQGQEKQRHHRYHRPRRQAQEHWLRRQLPPFPRRHCLYRYLRRYCWYPRRLARQ